MGSEMCIRDRNEKRVAEAEASRARHAVRHEQRAAEVTASLEATAHRLEGCRSGQRNAEAQLDEMTGSLQRLEEAAASNRRLEARLVQGEEAIALVARRISAISSAHVATPASPQGDGSLSSTGVVALLEARIDGVTMRIDTCLLYTSPSPRDS